MKATKRVRIWQFLSLCAVIGIGFLLRILYLGKPIWGDEATSWTIARRTPFWEMWAFASHDPSPPLYYAILHLTMPILGDSIIALRIPSVFFGTAILPIIYWSVRKASFNHRTGLHATLLAAVSSPLIYYAQEARAYALLAFLGALSVFLLFICLQKPGLVFRLVYFLTLLSIAYTHRYGYFLLAAQAGCALFYRKWNTFLVQILAGIWITGQFLLDLHNQSFNVGPSGGKTDFASIVSLINTLTTGTLGMQNIQRMPNPFLLSFPEPHINQLLPWLAALVYIGIFLIGVRGIRNYTQIQRQFMCILGFCIVLPILLAMLAGSPISPYPQWLLRGLIFTWVFLALITAVAITWSPKGIFLIEAVILIHGCALYAYYTNYTRFEDRAAFIQLNEQATAEDLVISDPWYMAYFIDYYYEGPAPIIGFDQDKGWLDVETMGKVNQAILIPLTQIPSPRGKIYVYYRKNELAWRSSFPDNPVYIYDPTLQSWTEFEP